LLKGRYLGVFSPLPLYRTIATLFLDVSDCQILRVARLVIHYFDYPFFMDIAVNVFERDTSGGYREAIFPHFNGIYIRSI
jgi:hypothetical protein